MGVRLVKGKDKKAGKDQVKRDCPYCGQEILVSLNAKDQKPLVDGLTIFMFAIVVILIAMLALMVQNGGL